MWKSVAWLSLFLSSLCFSVWVYSYATDEVRFMPEGSVLAGKRVFQRYNCVACHQVYGLGGYLGPDLTHLMSAPDKGPLYARAVILTGNYRMPAYPMTGEELDALLAFLSAADRSASERPVTPLRPSY
jgi:nitric oxide reductase subunit C